jgi:hypothetical protein
MGGAGAVSTVSTSLAGPSIADSSIARRCRHDSARFGTDHGIIVAAEK